MLGKGVSSQHVRLRDEGLSVGEIARRLGVSRQAVSDWFARHYPEYLRRTRIVPGPTKYVAGAVLLGGSTILSRTGGRTVLRCGCGEQYEMRLDSVATALRRVFIACAECRHRRLSERRRKSDPEAVLADYRSGMTWREIAAKHGYKTTKSVADSLRRAGVPAGRIKGRSWHVDDVRYPKEGE